MSEFEEILKMTGIVSVPALWITIANVIVLLCNVVIFVVKKIKAVKSNKDIEPQNKTHINMDTEDLEMTATELKQLAGGQPIGSTSECRGYCYSAAIDDNSNGDISSTDVVPFLQAMEDRERSSIRKAIVQAYIISKRYPNTITSQLTNDLLRVMSCLSVKDLASRLNIIVNIDAVEKTTFKEVVEPDNEGLKEITNDIRG